MPGKPAPNFRSSRRLPIGAELAPTGGTSFRVWAPRRQQVELLIGPDEDSARVIAMQHEGDAAGYFSALVPDVAAGDRYRFRLDGEITVPDPASRWQPDGPHGPSVVVDPSVFQWTDAAWRGPKEQPVLYEMHIGTFTTEGTWASAARELPALAELGITCLEIMPIAEFPGRFGWGYDGVDLFAPTRLYGTPDDFRAFVDRAHALGLGVILDVVYNHLGPDGNYLREFAEEYFNPRRTTDWGEAVNFDGVGSAAVREMAVANARYWIAEFHLDGLRLDATQNIYDDSARHILAEISAAVRQAAGARRTYIVGENEPQHARLMQPEEEGGYGLDALWNDDWHHSAMVAISGRDEAYYLDYLGTPGEFVAAAKFGFLYQGQWYSWQEQPRGTAALRLPPQRYVHFLQNHDQVANSFRGERLHRLASPARVRALTALLLLGPQTPMLFQGQEFGASNPFLYFADHRPELMKLVRTGRVEFMAQFQSIATPQASACLTDPGDEATFMKSKLDHGERERNAEVWTLHRDLLRLRREDHCFSRPRLGGVDGAPLRDGAFVLRFFGEGEHAGDDRLLLVNLGGPLRLQRMPEPLLAPSARGPWALRWSSEEPGYGGLCTPEYSPSMRDWYIPGDCALVFAPESGTSTANDTQEKDA